MKFIISVEADDEVEVLYSAPLPSELVDYIERVKLHMKAISSEEYTTGPAAILGTLARFSYVLDGETVLWLIEWKPGLVVLAFAEGGTPAMASIRSPIPGFAGQPVLPGDGQPDDYDSDENPQYDLVFTPWDAQFDAQRRAWASSDRADEETAQRFLSILAAADALGAGDREGAPDWEQCFRNLDELTGEGVRLRNVSLSGEPLATSPT